MFAALDLIMFVGLAMLGCGDCLLAWGVVCMFGCDLLGAMSLVTGSEVLTFDFGDGLIS